MKPKDCFVLPTQDQGGTGSFESSGVRQRQLGTARNVDLDG
jgi:hypothetical protein